MVLVNSSPPSPRSPLQPEKTRQKTQRKSREAEACCSNDWAWVRTLFTYRRTTHPFPAPSLLISLSLSLALCFSLLTHKYTHIPFLIFFVCLPLYYLISHSMFYCPPPPHPVTWALRPRSRICSCLRGLGPKVKPNRAAMPPISQDFIKNQNKKYWRLFSYSSPLSKEVAEQKKGVVENPARRFLWLVLFSSWSCAWIRWKTESEWS